MQLDQILPGELCDVGVHDDVASPRRSIDIIGLDLDDAACLEAALIGPAGLDQDAERRSFPAPLLVTDRRRTVALRHQGGMRLGGDPGGVDRHRRPTRRS